MLTTRPGSDVEKLPGFIDVDLVPDAAGDDHGLAGFHRDVPVAVLQFQPDPDPTGQKVEQLVAVGMHLTSVPGWPSERGGLDGVAHDTVGRLVGGSRHEHGASRLPLQPYGALGQLERVSDRYVAGDPHADSSHTL